jgi:hypothetical protein
MLGRFSLLIREIERPNSHFNGLGVSRQVDSEQATFRVARYPTTIIEHYAIWRFTSASPSKGVSLS